MSKVSVLPIWKKGATVAERLHEMALYAEEHPERFERWVMCYAERLGDKTQYRVMWDRCDLTQSIGMFEIGKVEAMKE